MWDWLLGPGEQEGTLGFHCQDPALQPQTLVPSLCVGTDLGSTHWDIITG